MKTTLMLDDALFRQAKLRAAERNASLSELVNQSLRSYLHATTTGTRRPPVFIMPVYGRAESASTGVTPAALAALRDDGR